MYSLHPETLGAHSFLSRSCAVYICMQQRVSTGQIGVTHFLRQLAGGRCWRNKRLVLYAAAGVAKEARIARKHAVQQVLLLCFLSPHVALHCTWLLCVDAAAGLSTRGGHLSWGAAHLLLFNGFPIPKY